MSENYLGFKEKAEYAQERKERAAAKLVADLESERIKHNGLLCDRIAEIIYRFKLGGDPEKRLDYILELMADYKPKAVK